MPIETGQSNILTTYVTFPDLTAYLPLAGGTMTGSLTMTNPGNIYLTDNYLHFGIGGLGRMSLGSAFDIYSFGKDMNIIAIITGGSPTPKLYLGGYDINITSSNEINFINGAINTNLTNIVNHTHPTLITSADVPFYRSFYGDDGQVVQGTWVWSNNGYQTDQNNVRGHTVGFYSNTSGNINDEYKWIDCYLGKGSYEIDLSFVKTPGAGKMEILFGSQSIDILDMYAAGNTYNQTYGTLFDVTVSQLADFRIRCTSKNVASSAYQIFISKLVIWKYA